MKRKEQDGWNQNLQDKFNELKSLALTREGINNTQAFMEVLNDLKPDDQKKILEHQSIYDGMTLINASAYWGAVDTAKHLLELAKTVGADINIANDFGNTPAHHAAYINSTSMVNVFQDARADFTLKNLEVKTPDDIIKSFLATKKDMALYDSRDESSSSYEEVNPSAPSAVGASHARLRKVDAGLSSGISRSSSVASLDGYDAPALNGGGVSMKGSSKDERIEFEKRATDNKDVYEFHPKAENEAECGNGYVKETWTEGGYVYQPIPGNKMPKDGKTYIVTIPCKRNTDGTFSAECETLTFSREGKLIDYHSDKPGMSQLNKAEFKKQFAEMEAEKAKSPEVDKATSLQKTLSRGSSNSSSRKTVNLESVSRELIRSVDSSQLIQPATKINSSQAFQSKDKARAFNVPT